jgi:hypothetical protein
MKGSDEIARTRTFEDGTCEAMTRRLREPEPAPKNFGHGHSYHRRHREDTTTLPRYHLYEQIKGDYGGLCQWCAVPHGTGSKIPLLRSLFSYSDLLLRI